MSATAISRVSKIQEVEITVQPKNLLKTLPYPPRRARRRCPATILADKRIAKVSGRIRELILSIKTINGIRTVGVPRGTRWASIWPVLNTTLNTVNLNQILNANLNEKTICLEGVKLYLSKPRTFLLTIKLKIALNNKTLCFNLLPKTELNSLTSLLTTLSFTKSTLLGRTHTPKLININTQKTELQLSTRPPLTGSKIENKFIIISRESPFRVTNSTP